MTFKNLIYIRFEIRNECRNNDDGGSRLLIPWSKETYKDFNTQISM